MYYFYLFVGFLCVSAVSCSSKQSYMEPARLPVFVDSSKILTLKASSALPVCNGFKYIYDRNLKLVSILECKAESDTPLTRNGDYNARIELQLNQEQTLVVEQNLRRLIAEKKSAPLNERCEDGGGSAFVQIEDTSEKSRTYFTENDCGSGERFVVDPTIFYQVTTDLRKYVLSQK